MRNCQNVCLYILLYMHRLWQSKHINSITKLFTVQTLKQIDMFNQYLILRTKQLLHYCRTQKHQKVHIIKYIPHLVGIYISAIFFIHFLSFKGNELKETFLFPAELLLQPNALQ